MINGHAESGFILLDAVLNPVAFNPEALQILAFPENVEHIQRPALFLFDKVHRSLLSNRDSENVQFVKFYKSGKRSYNCRVFRLECGDTIRSRNWTALLLERNSANVAALAELAQRYDLTTREREVVEFLLQGMTSKEIAARMKISANTVKAFLRIVMVKMNVSTRSGIVGKITTMQ